MQPIILQNGKNNTCFRVNVRERKRNAFWSVFEEKTENLHSKDGRLQNCYHVNFEIN